MKQLMLPVEVKKSNAIIRAKWQPQTVWEPRLVALVAAQIKPSDKDFQTYKIPLVDMMGVDSADSMGGNDYARLRDVAKRIVGSVICIENEEAQEFDIYGIFSKCTYRKGAISVQFHPDLKPHFLQLKDHFTRYNLLEFMLLTSVYSQRMFEILSSWRDKPEITLDLVDLQDRLGVPDSFRNRYPDFRRKVLEPAHKNITAKTSFVYEWEPVKKGRAVIGVRFVFSKKRVAEVEAKEESKDAQKAMQEANLLFKKALACKASGPCTTPKKNKVCKVCRESL